MIFNAEVHQPIYDRIGGGRFHIPPWVWRSLLSLTSSIGSVVSEAVLEDGLVAWSVLGVAEGAVVTVTGSSSEAHPGSGGQYEDPEPSNLDARLIPRAEIRGLSVISTGAVPSRGGSRWSAEWQVLLRTGEPIPVPGSRAQDENLREAAANVAQSISSLIANA